MSHAVREEAPRLWGFLAYLAPLFADRSAVHQGQAHPLFALVGEGIRPEFVALINYGIVGLIQIYNGFSDTVDINNEEAMALYDKYAKEALELMKRKNHDYDEAWRGMRVSSYTDFILTKIERIKEIENLGGDTLVSEGIDSNYMDIINYAVFGAIKLSEEE